MMHMPQVHAARTDTGYDFSPTLSLIKPYAEAAHIAVANLETTFGGKPYTGYPNFSSPDTLAWQLADAGFDILTTANNHTADRGGRGISRTLDVLDSAGILHTGSYRNQEERQSNSPLIIDKEGLKVALVAYTYGLNGNRAHPPSLVSLIDTAEINRDIDYARFQKVDFIICSIHWGEEYQRTPNKVQLQLAQYLRNKGVDVIIGSHPHVVQKVDYIQQDTTLNADTVGLIAYSLGNFVSNQQDYPTRLGLSIGFTLKRTTKGVNSICDIYELPSYVSRRNKAGEARYLVMPLQRIQEHITGLSPPEVAEIARYKKDMR